MRQKVRIISTDDALIRSNDNSVRWIEKCRQLGNGNVAGPFARVGRTVVWHAAIARLSDRHYTRRVITDVAVDVGIDDVLSRRSERFECGVELLPVTCAIQCVLQIGIVLRRI